MTDSIEFLEKRRDYWAEESDRCKRKFGEWDNLTVFAREMMEDYEMRLFDAYAEADTPEPPANTARLEAEARRADDDDNRPARQPRDL